MAARMLRTLFQLKPRDVPLRVALRNTAAVVLPNTTVCTNTPGSRTCGACGVDFTGDGYYGWEEHAPFDAIIVTAAAPEAPPALIEQLKIGGRLVIPVGIDRSVQELLRVVRVSADEYKTEDIADVRFVPLVGEEGRAAEIALQEAVHDLLLLDLGLPRKDGIEVLTAMRRRGVTPEGLRAFAEAAGGFGRAGYPLRGRELLARHDRVELEQLDAERRQAGREALTERVPAAEREDRERRVLGARGHEGEHARAAQPAACRRSE